MLELAKWKSCGIMISDQGFTAVGFKDPMLMVNLHPQGRYYPTREEAKALLNTLEDGKICPKPNNPGNPGKRAEWINCSCKKTGSGGPSTGTDCVCRVHTGVGKKKRTKDIDTKGIAIVLLK